MGEITCLVLVDDAAKLTQLLSHLYAKLVLLLSSPLATGSSTNDYFFIESKPARVPDSLLTAFRSPVSKAMFRAQQNAFDDAIGKAA